MQNQAFVPRFLEKTNDSLVANVLAVFAGVVLMTILAQISIHLAFTPVPITGQTFGVTLIALMWGRGRALAAVGSYLALGMMGLPILAGGALLAPTAGYLVGMFFAALLMGFLSDLGWTRKFHTAWFAAVLGSVVVFAFGLLGLRLFLPKADLLAVGLLPFLFGDFIKDLVASQIAVRCRRTLN